MLPFTPISEELLARSWIQEEYPVLAEVDTHSIHPFKKFCYSLALHILPFFSSQAYARPSPPLSEGWKGYIVMAHAIIDPEAAWEEALQLTAYDDGNTKSNTLYWIASREPPQPPQPTDHPTPTTTAGPLPQGCDCHPGGVTRDPR